MALLFHFSWFMVYIAYISLYIYIYVYIFKQLFHNVKIKVLFRVFFYFKMVTIFKHMKQHHKNQE